MMDWQSNPIANEQTWTAEKENKYIKMNEPFNPILGSILCMPGNIQSLINEIRNSPELVVELLMQLVEQPNILDVLMNPVESLALDFVEKEKIKNMQACSGDSISLKSASSFAEKLRSFALPFDVDLSLSKNALIINPESSKSQKFIESTVFVERKSVVSSHSLGVEHPFQRRRTGGLFASLDFPENAWPKKELFDHTLFSIVFSLYASSDEDEPFLDVFVSTLIPPLIRSVLSNQSPQFSLHDSFLHRFAFILWIKFSGMDYLENIFSPLIIEIAMFRELNLNLDVSQILSCAPLHRSVSTFLYNRLQNFLPTRDDTVDLSTTKGQPKQGKAERTLGLGRMEVPNTFQSRDRARLVSNPSREVDSGNDQNVEVGSKTKLIKTGIEERLKMVRFLCELFLQRLVASVNDFPLAFKQVLTKIRNDMMTCAQKSAAEVDILLMPFVFDCILLPPLRMPAKYSLVPTMLLEWSTVQNLNIVADVIHQLAIQRVYPDDSLYKHLNGFLTDNFDLVAVFYTSLFAESEKPTFNPAPVVVLPVICLSELDIVILHSLVYALYTNKAVFLPKNLANTIFSSTLEGLIKLLGIPLREQIWTETELRESLKNSYHVISVQPVWDNAKTILLPRFNEYFFQLRKKFLAETSSWLQSDLDLSVLALNLSKIGLHREVSILSDTFFVMYSGIVFPKSVLEVEGLMNLLEQLYFCISDLFVSPFVTLSKLNSSATLAELLEHARSCILGNKNCISDESIRLLARLDYVIPKVTYALQKNDSINAFLFHICNLFFELERTRFEELNQIYLKSFDQIEVTMNRLLDRIHASIQRHLHQASWIGSFGYYDHNLIARTMIHVCPIPVCITLSLSKNETNMFLQARNSRSSLSPQGMHTKKSSVSTNSLTMSYENIYTASNPMDSSDLLNVELNRYSLSSFSIFGFVEGVKQLIKDDFYHFPHLLAALVNEFLNRLVPFFFKPGGTNMLTRNKSESSPASNEVMRQSVHSAPNLQLLMDHRMDFCAFGAVDLCQLVNDPKVCIDKVRLFEDARSYILHNLFVYLFKSAATNFKDDALTKRIESFKWVQPRHLDFACNEIMQIMLERACKELNLLNNYRDSKLKLLCMAKTVDHCTAAISLGADNSSPGADALLPVLIYILIRVNPADLLSNVVFCTTFWSRADVVFSKYASPSEIAAMSGCGFKSKSCESVFCSPSRDGWLEYCLIQFRSAVSFLERIDRSQLIMTAADE